MSTVRTINVIGAGWYGCHVAKTLREEGYEIAMFEAGEDFFVGASGANQSRLHLGFHYPRCHWTRSTSARGYVEFMQTYPHLTGHVRTNLYAVADQKSFVDYRTYLSILGAPRNVDMLDARPRDYNLHNLDGVVETSERLILAEQAREYFREHLADVAEFGVRITDDRIAADPDQIWIDCTYGARNAPPGSWYERR